jgi:hypothetical protein
VLPASIERPDRSRHGRSPYDAVLMFKVLVLQALCSLSDEQAEFQLCDRRLFIRLAGFYDLTRRHSALGDLCPSNTKSAPWPAAGSKTAFGQSGLGQEG